MNLSKNFTAEEFVSSQVAARMGIPNDPPLEVVAAMKFTAAGLEKIRTLLGDKPVIISSGYRSPSLNSAVHGSPNSQHVKGEAVDFTCPSYGGPNQIVRAIIASGIAYDQVIAEYVTSKTGGWVHVSFNNHPRRQALTIDNFGTRAFT